MINNLLASAPYVPPGGPSGNIQEGFNPPFGTAENPISDLIGVFIQSAIILAGVTSIFLIIVGGFHIISSAGEPSPDKTARGKNMFTYGIAGFAVVLTAFWVIRIIELTVGYSFFTTPKLPGIIDVSKTPSTPKTTPPGKLPPKGP